LNHYSAPSRRQFSLVSTRRRRTLRALII
jgi:hypothetical protein